jgi:hypothetical protein
MSHGWYIVFYIQREVTIFAHISEMKGGEIPETNNSNLNEDEGNVNNNHEL